MGYEGVGRLLTALRAEAGMSLKHLSSSGLRYGCDPLIEERRASFGVSAECIAIGRRASRTLDTLQFNQTSCVGLLSSIAFNGLSTSRYVVVGKDRAGRALRRSLQSGSFRNTSVSPFTGRLLSSPNIIKTIQRAHYLIYMLFVKS